MLQEKRYQVKYEGKIYNARLELHESGAFKYGNGTMVLYYDGINERPQQYDTRYERGIVANFGEWADNFIKDLCDKSCEIMPA